MRLERRERGYRVGSRREGSMSGISGEEISETTTRRRRREEGRRLGSQYVQLGLERWE